MKNIKGLNDEEVIKYRKKYGRNEILKEKHNTFFELFIESLSDPIIKILLIALTIKIVFLFRNFNWFETLGILIAIFLSSFISTISEYGSEKAFSKLQEESLKLKCKVIRNGKLKEVFISDVVMHDIIKLEGGDKVPADGILIKGNLSVDESAISGESKEAYKESVINNNVSNKNKVFMGCSVYTGSAIVEVTNIADNTFYGKIASELNEKKDESPLKQRLRNLAKTISIFGYLGAFLASFSYLFSVIIVNNHFDIKSIVETITNFNVISNHLIYALTLCVTIIIVSVPEGLPMMITLVLSSNMKRMLKSNVLVRKLVGIETAGSLNILFTDKTGTLTEGKLSCDLIIDGNLNEYRKESDLKHNNYLEILKVSMILNNMSSYEENNTIGGNTTDKCLLSFFKPYDYNYIKKIKTIPFDSKNKYMITVIDDKIAKNLIKGAPEKIIDNCAYFYDQDGKKQIFNKKNIIKDKILKREKEGMRVIALATSNNLNEKDFSNLVFVGAIFIKDRIRKEAYKAIEKVENAGIKVIMITGDNKNTATAIGKELGLINNGDDLVLTSDELNNISDYHLKKMIPKLKIVARALPYDKSRLVRISKEMNLVVGMTGDGINDAPALKKSDVGFALGSGSEVAKEAGDIVILDNNFLSISNAILFGRTIFKSIRKFIIFQLTVNLCALAISIIGPFIGVDTPVTVIQMLWINMVMDTLAGLAFAYEPHLDEYMNEKPKDKNEHIINSYMYNEILLTGIYTTLICIVFLKVPLIRNFYNDNQTFMTAFFGLFVFCGIFNCFNSHTGRINIFSNLLKNKMFIMVMLFVGIVQVLMIYYGGSLFRTTPLNIFEFLFMLILSITVLPFDMIRKVLCKKFNKSYDV